MIEDILTLPDGRSLGYGVYGNPQGIPIVDFHGIPGSRLEAALIASTIKRKDLSIIGIDRPGYGRSSAKPGFQIADFPADVARLADHLRLDKFIAFGFSGGGPFALACACKISDRLSALGIVSGLGPAEIGSGGMFKSNQEKFNLARRHPHLSRLLLSAGFSSLRRHPDKLAEKLKKIQQQMPEADRQVFEDPVFSQKINEITIDSINNSVRGWANEEILAALPWTFNLSEIPLSNIFLWHGELDHNVPMEMAKAVAARLPSCRFKSFPNEGHMSLLYHHGDEIFSTLVNAGLS